MNFIFKCSICEEDFPSIHRHVHHKIPKSLGGTDDKSNLSELCPQCHDLLHNVAYKMVSKKVSYVNLEDMVKVVYNGNLNAVLKCLEYASLVRDEIIKSKETEKNVNDFTEISLKIKVKHKNLLHKWSKNTNISLERLIRSIILKAISDKYSVTIDLHSEEESIKNYKRNGN